MTMKLRDLIRAVRACKTAAEERGVISTECALIRTAIKEEDERYRHRNVAKLMYIHMLGYPTHFGQMECLKLISAAGFPEKRIGYLALTLLLTEQTEVLTLVTNSLKVDLTNANQYIQGLSLIVIGNMATPDMARDLSSDVEKLLKCSNPYLRKKAALATIRLCRKEPDLIELMAPVVVPLLKDKAHGVLITGIQLMMDIIDMEPSTRGEYAKMTSSIVRLLRQFVNMGFSPEHDVGGIADPFVQVKLLSLLRRLGKGNDEASEQMGDVLAQVATNTESAKNAGNAILYECVQTIMAIQSDGSLRTLAVNILGRFLLNRDNNIRYVALNSLSRVVSEDIQAVQRHRDTIVDCLKDADISIRQRALELIYQLVNETNVDMMTTELLNYLVVASSDQRGSLVSNILSIVERFSPSKKWRVDTIVTLLSVAGSELDDTVSRTAILFIAQADGLQGYAVHRLYKALQEDSDQLGVLQTGLWCIGEYGEHLTQPQPSYPGEAGNPGGNPALTEQEVVSMVSKCMRLHNSDAAIKSMALNALIKLSVRFTQGSTAQIGALLQTNANSMNLELQQRSVEYSTLLGAQWDGLRGNLLGSMPVMDEASLRKKRMVESADMLDTSGGISDRVPMSSSGGPVVGTGGGGGGGLLDLDDIFGGGGAPTPAPMAAQAPTMPVASGGMDLLGSPMAPAPAPAADPMGGGDLLSDIFAGTAAPAQVDPLAAFPPQAPAPAPAPVPMAMGGMDLLGSPAASAPSGPTLVAFDKGGLKCTMELSKPNPADPSKTRITCKFSNDCAFPISNLVFQVSVPKYLTLLEMQPASGSSCPAKSVDSVTQIVNVNNNMQGQKNITLRVKIVYSLNNQTVDEVAVVSNFPALY